MQSANVLSLHSAFGELRFVGDRTPTSTEAELRDAFATLAAYRDGAIYVGHYAGDSEWERHQNGDEIVFVVEGETTLYLMDGSEDVPQRLGAGMLIVVPRGVWHRFETKEAVKVLTVTPQPTDHSVERPAPPDTRP